MNDKTLLTDGPLVSVMTATFNRRDFLPDAIRCFVKQTYRNTEMILVNDGGADLSDIVSSFNDPRIKLIQNKENKGKAACLNQGLSHARGKYVAYLDDDDIHYPHHVAALVTALEGPTDCQVAYSDLYRTMCRVGPGGKRVALGKYLEIIRDFDRFFMFHFNHVLHVSVMHRRELLDKTGPYNEQVKVLIDWDMTRRLAFYTDFLHVRDATGEYSIPEGNNDRISHRMRKDPQVYERNVRMIRATRPPKPWPKVKDLSIIVMPRQMDLQAADVIGRIWEHTFVPYQVYLPLGAEDLASLNTLDMANLVPVPVSPQSPPAGRLDICLRHCQGDCVAIVPPAMPVEAMWVEKALYSLVHCDQPNTGFFLNGSPDPSELAVVMRKEDLLAARAAHPALPLRASLQEAGVTLLWPDRAGSPFKMDEFLRTSEDLQEEGAWAKAAEIYRNIPAKFANNLWMKEHEANALYHLGSQDAAALDLCRQINAELPTVDSLLLEARLLRRQGQLAPAAERLEQARKKLQWMA